MIYGWVKLHRDIQSHWIFKEDKFYKWWTIMLFNANHKNNKITLGYSVHKIEIGQCANSIRTWARLFNCSTKQVEKFFKLLESDNMITREIIGKGKQSTTLININNYAKYQHLEETQETTQRTTQETTQKKRKELREGGTTKESKEYKEIEEGKELIKKFSKNDFKKTLIELGADVSHVEDWMIVRNNKKLAPTETALKKFIKECEVNNFKISDAVRICAEKSWGGFNYQWILNSQSTNKQKPTFEPNR